jgi:hypothetical protein
MFAMELGRPSKSVQTIYSLATAQFSGQRVAARAQLSLDCWSSV